MISVTIYNKNNKIVGFRSEGHAGYDETGKDIVCAAVSTLVINTVNSIDSFTEDEYVVDQDEDNASIEFRLTTNEPSKESLVLLNAMKLGLSSVMQGNTEYLSIFSEEV